MGQDSAEDRLKDMLHALRQLEGSDELALQDQMDVTCGVVMHKSSEADVRALGRDTRDGLHARHQQSRISPWYVCARSNGDLNSLL
jgi:hypothetical protein